MEAWYLVYTKPRQETVALTNLERQGYATYLPLARTRRRRGGRIVPVIEPMFPRYLFVHLSDLTDDWGPMHSTIGVSKFVKFGTDAARVPPGLISLLKSREDGEGVQILHRAAPERGDRVKIVDGLLAGYEAIFEAGSGKVRVLLLLEIAGRAARIQVDADHIEPVAHNRRR